MSLRPRSISIRCSASSFGSASSSCLERPVLLVVVAAAPGAGDRPHRHLAVFQAHQDLRRGADDLEIAQIEEVHIRRGIEAAQRAVQIQWPRAERDRQALRDHHLHAVAVEDVLLDPLDRRFETGLGETGDEIRFAHRARALRPMPGRTLLHALDQRRRSADGSPPACRHGRYRRARSGTCVRSGCRRRPPRRPPSTGCPDSPADPVCRGLRSRGSM